MNDLVIRSLKSGDLDALLGLYAQLNPEDAPLSKPEALKVWNQIVQDPKMHCLGGFIGNTLACSCVLTITPNLTRGGRPFGLIENVITDSAHRTRGYGHALLRHARELAWKQGCYKVMLLTGRKDQATLQFYESAGFDRHAKQAFYCAAPA